MSTLPENEFDLEKLFLPAWAQEEPSSAKYAKYEGETERPERRDRRGGPRPRRREGGPGERREGFRPRRERSTGRPGEARRPGQPPGTEAGPGQPGAERRFRHGDRRGPRPERPEHREPPRPLPEVSVSLEPEEKGVDSLARQIKMTGRAFPLFEIAQMILQKPDRHVVVFNIKKNPEGQPIQPLFLCALDDTLWLSEDEAVAHVLRKHFNTFYQAEKTATEPPKGKYTFVAQCGMSGVILGPPNHHDYQNQLRKLHTERFSRMPFEVYKSRVKIVRDEAVVKQWVDDQSWKTEYICLNMPEPLRLVNMEAVEKHFRESHKDNIIKPVEKHTLTGTAARNLRCQELARLVRVTVEDQRRFPLQIATVLSQQFAARGLQFFKVNKTITHVSVARPHYLDMALTPVSEGVKRIVDYVNANPRCTRRQLVETLAPTPPPAPIPIATPAPATDTVPTPPEGQPAAPVPVPPPADQPTPEQTAVIADLHWLIHQGHVIEFANGTLETAKKPVPKPPKPPKPEVAAQPAEGVTPTEPAPVGEAAATSAPAVEGAVAAPETPAVTPAEATPQSAEPAPDLSPTTPPLPAEPPAPEAPPAAEKDAAAPPVDAVNSPEPVVSLPTQQS